MEMWKRVMGQCGVGRKTEAGWGVGKRRLDKGGLAGEAWGVGELVE